jgi:hypothetical protein
MRKLDREVDFDPIKQPRANIKDSFQSRAAYQEHATEGKRSMNEVAIAELCAF